ncbi:MAG: DUF2294 domain-containing protein [Pirellulales bacterium]|nr:DUF2294 domain-containing protein [Pirellulales bacterium]
MVNSAIVHHFRTAAVRKWWAIAGRRPKDIRAYLIGDLLMVRLEGVLTAAEQHLVLTLPAEKGRDLLKQVRTQLIETARPTLESLVHNVTGIKPRSLHGLY